MWLANLRQIAPLLAVWTLGLVVTALGAQAAIPTAASPRPIYVIGHRTNSLQEVSACLSLGANAIEVDVNVYARAPAVLCVDHGPLLGQGPAKDNAPRLAEFLAGLRSVATGTQLALIYFDLKPPAATAPLAAELLRAIREHLEPATAGGPRWRIILSVAKHQYASAFGMIQNQLRAHELVMIDQARHPRQAADHLVALGIPRFGIGNGISMANGLLSLAWPPLRLSLRDACRVRDQQRGAVFVSTFTVNSERAMRQYLRLGIDGIISDRVPPFYCRGAGLARLIRLVQEEGVAFGVRMATPDDVPFAAPAPLSTLTAHAVAH